jgi:hypothetical protein
LKLLLAALLLALPARAQTVACHVDYGGEVRRIEAGPIENPYAVPAVQVGSYFLFRLVVERGTAIKTYVYADRDDAGPTMLHQGTWPWPPAKGGEYGFSGLHHVYEPVRDGELKFWCERY